MIFQYTDEYGSVFTYLLEIDTDIISDVSSSTDTDFILRYYTR